MAKSPYSFKLCKHCGEYDFAGDFRSANKVITWEREMIIRDKKVSPGVLPCIVLICSTCYEKAYLDEEESDEEYKFRMAARLCK